MFRIQTVELSNFLSVGMLLNHAKTTAVISIQFDKEIDYELHLHISLC